MDWSKQASSLMQMQQERSALISVLRPLVDAEAWDDLAFIHKHLDMAFEGRADYLRRDLTPIYYPPEQRPLDYGIKQRLKLVEGQPEAAYTMNGDLLPVPTLTYESEPYCQVCDNTEWTWED